MHGSDTRQSATSPPGLSSPTPDQPVLVADIDSLNFTARLGSDQDGLISAQKNFPTSLEDIGLPLNQLWDHDAAYDCRFCFDYGETEYLLGTANRWMSSGDFDTPNAVSLLKTRLRRHKDNHLDFEPHLQKCQAECCGSLWSHVHSVIDWYEYNGASLYLVQWKVCWTPESNIDDKAWVMVSLKANQHQHNRHSTRQEDSFEDRKKGYDKMMLVVNLD